MNVVAVCQFNPIIGAVEYNLKQLLKLARNALHMGADYFIAPELALCGYPPKDIILNYDFIKICNFNLKKLAEISPIPILLGAPEWDGGQIFNSAFLCFNDKINIVARKQLLPNYGVFDEKRYFTAGTKTKFYGFESENKRFGVSICEDAWANRIFCKDLLPIIYNNDPIKNLVSKFKIDILINLNASPFEKNKIKLRETLFRCLAKYYRKPLISVSQVGANDGLIFDGGSMAINRKGDVLSKVENFKEGLFLINIQSLLK